MDAPPALWPVDGPGAPRARRRAPVYLLLGVALSLAACGGGSGGTSAPPGSGGPNPAGSTAGPGGSSAPQRPPPLAACPADNAVFTRSPVALEHVQFWMPLGNVNPPGHTFPTDHQYLFLRQPQEAVPLVAPSPIRILGVGRAVHWDGSVDYDLFFQPCADLMARFGHVGGLTAQLLEAIGPFDRRCDTWSAVPGYATTRCESRDLALDLPAGTVLGTAGKTFSFAFDWWLQDRRVPTIPFSNPARFGGVVDASGFGLGRTVAASDYFTGPEAAAVAAKIGNGAVNRTALPLGGALAPDASGTAQGRWFSAARLSDTSEASHLALVPDAVQPERLHRFSIGLSQPNVGALQAPFEWRTTGRVNRRFDTVVPDGQVYCYEFGGAPWTVLLQMPDAATLRLEVRPDLDQGCPAGLPPLGADAVTYVR